MDLEINFSVVGFPTQSFVQYTFTVLTGLLAVIQYHSDGTKNIPPFARSSTPFQRTNDQKRILSRLERDQLSEETGRSPFYWKLVLQGFQRTLCRDLHTEITYGQYITSKSCVSLRQKRSLINTSKKRTRRISSSDQLEANAKYIGSVLGVGGYQNRVTTRNKGPGFSKPITATVVKSAWVFCFCEAGYIGCTRQQLGKEHLSSQNKSRSIIKVMGSFLSYRCDVSHALPKGVVSGDEQGVPWVVDIDRNALFGNS
ncbi:hypothetical protein CLF_109376 [Clonorchis sinensis]|uniref:Helix-turn-helix domain-containing protein n=1 Tax=Clonorchis sinensis TaxID=79923 RepID=G7YJA0_CLOSI|nr:hypothetical protein CLF_109376 [Clonorchis sinensis]